MSLSTSCFFLAAVAAGVEVKKTATPRVYAVEAATVSYVSHTAKRDAALHICARTAHLRVCGSTISCQSSRDPPPLGSSDRIPQVLGSVFQAAVGDRKKSKQAVAFPLRIALRRCFGRSFFCFF